MHTHISRLRYSLLALPLLALWGTGQADARLIFTTENDGTEASSWTIDLNDASATTIDLNFGTALGASIVYDTVTQQFVVNQPVDFQGNELLSPVLHNSATAPTTCSGTNPGQVYFNTTDALLYYCDGTAWVTSNNITAGSIIGTQLNSAIAGAGLSQNGSGNLDVNVDGSTIVITGDTLGVATGGITTTQIADGTITATDLAANTITATEINTGAVTTDEILDGTITATDIAADTITAGQIATGAVTTAEILDGTIATVDIADDAVTVAQIGTAGATDADKVLTTDASGNPVWESRLNFTSSVLPDGQIYIGDGSNTATPQTVSGDITMTNTGVVDIQPNTITTLEVAADSLLAADIATGAVTTDEILDGTVATADMADDSITLAKLRTAGATDADKIYTTDASGNPQLESKSIFMSSALASGQFYVGDATGTATAVTLSGDITVSNTGVVTIAPNSVSSTEIIDGTIVAADIATDTITVSQIATGAVTTDEILDDTITAADIATGAVTTDEILDGTIATVDIANDAITTDKILDGTITLADIAVREVAANVRPEYPNFTLQADGTANVGTLLSDYDASIDSNYYQWSTTNTTAQDYDIVFQWMIPENFQGFSTANPAMEIDYYTTSGAAAQNSLTLTMTDSTGAAVTLPGVAGLTTGGSWVEDQAVAFTGGTFTAGEYLTVRIHMVGRRLGGTSYVSRMGKIRFNYLAK